MSKQREERFLPIPRQLFKEYSNLSWKAQWLFVVLCELEHRFTQTNGKDDFFFRGQSDLSKDSGMTPASNRKYRQELADSGLIKFWKMHWNDPETGKKSERHTIAYKILI